METRGIPQQSADKALGGFAELGISAPVVEALDRIGFHSPTPIQAAVIPSALAGRDVIGLAETGSGKTAAFSLPLLEQTEATGRCAGLVVCPTREIALQTERFLSGLVGLKGLRTACLIGGVKLPGRKPSPEELASPQTLADIEMPGRTRIPQPRA